MGNLNDQELRGLIARALAILDAPDEDGAVWCDEDEVVPGVPWCATEIQEEHGIPGVIHCTTGETVPVWVMESDDTRLKVVPREMVPAWLVPIFLIVSVALWMAVVLLAIRLVYLLVAALSLILWLMVSSL